MRKNVVFGLLSVVVGAISTLTGYAQLTTLTEGFDTVGTPGPPSTGIFASGWVVINNSNPIGDHTWNQGIPGTQTDGLGVNAQSDPPSAANAFIQTDFNAGMPGSGAIVSDWLIRRSSCWRMALRCRFTPRPVQTIRSFQTNF